MVRVFNKITGEYSEAELMPPGGSPPQGTKWDRGHVTSADNSTGEPWPGTIDQTVYKRQSGGLNTRQVQLVAVDPFTGNPIVAGGNGNRPADIIQNIPAPQVAAAPKYSTLDTVTPLDINRLGLTTSPFATPAERAIAEVTINGGSMPPTGGANRGRPSNHGSPPKSFIGNDGRTYTLETTPDPLLPGGTIYRSTDPKFSTGDSWAGLRIAPTGPGRQGLVTGTPGGAVAEALAARQESHPSPSAVAAALMEQARVTNDPLMAAAMAQGRTSYVSPTNNGALADNALMPTVAMNGNPLRNR